MYAFVVKLAVKSLGQSDDRTAKLVAQGVITAYPCPLFATNLLAKQISDVVYSSALYFKFSKKRSRKFTVRDSYLTR